MAVVDCLVKYFPCVILSVLAAAVKQFRWLVWLGLVGSLGIFLAGWWKLGQAVRLIPGSLRRAVPEEPRLVMGVAGF